MKVILALIALACCASTRAQTRRSPFVCPRAGHKFPDPANLCVFWECRRVNQAPVEVACPKGTRVPTWWEGGTLNMCFVRNIVEHGGDPKCDRCEVSDVKIDDSCASGNNPCPTNCRCIDIEHTHRCDCPFDARAQVTWPNAPAPVDHCLSNPCQNGAKCQNHWNDYFCICPARYTGKNCDIPICEWNPCQNGGTCQVNEVGFHCICNNCFMGSCCNITDPSCGERPTPITTPHNPVTDIGTKCPDCQIWNGTACIETCRCLKCEQFYDCVDANTGAKCVPIKECPRCYFGGTVTPCIADLSKCECNNPCRQDEICSDGLDPRRPPQCRSITTPTLPPPPPRCGQCQEWNGSACVADIYRCECSSPCRAQETCTNSPFPRTAPSCTPRPTPAPCDLCERFNGSACVFSCRCLACEPPFGCQEFPTGAQCVPVIECARCFVSISGAPCEADRSRCECNNPCKADEVCSDGPDPRTPPTCTKSNPSSGRTFTIMFEENNTEQPKPEIPLEVYVTPSAPNSGTRQINIKSAGLSSNDQCYFSQDLTVPQNGVLRIPVQRCMRHNGTGLQNLAIRVTELSGEEEKFITVYGINRDTFSADGFLAFPDNQAGTNFQTVSYSPAHIASQFGVVALEDDTTVTMELADDNDLPAPNNVKGSRFTVTMKAFQTFQVQARCGSGPATRTSTCSKDLTGSVIRSNKPIHVFSGDIRSAIPGGQAESRDHLIEQILPTNRWGKQFGIMGVPDRAVGDLVNIMALKGSTTRVQIFKTNGATDTFDLPLNGKLSVFKELESGARTFIKSNHPIFVTMYTKSSDKYLYRNESLHDPSSITIPPVDQYTNNFFLSTPFYSGGVGNPRPYNTNLVLLVAREGDQSTIKIDGRDPDLVSNWAPLPKGPAANDPVLVGAVAKVNHGTSLIESSGGNFGCLAYGYDDRESYGFPVAMNYKVIN